MVGKPRHASADTTRGELVDSEWLRLGLDVEHLTLVREHLALDRLGKRLG